MGDDLGRDLIPVKDSSASTSKPMAGTQYSSHEQKTVAKWNRAELEDKYFRLYDENIILKKYTRKQEDKIKRMATKLLRLINDRKAKDQEKGINGAPKKRDVETEQMIEEMQDRIRELERHNKFLQEKLVVARQQLTTQLTRPVPLPYRHISSRIDTGIAKSAPKMVLGNAAQSSGRNSRIIYSNCAQNDGLTESRMDSEMEMRLSALREQIDSYELEIADLKEQLRVSEMEHDEEIFAVKSQLSQEQRQILQENVTLIRLQRELKHKESQLTALETHCAELNETLAANRRCQEQVVTEMDSLHYQLQEEQQKTISLQNEIKLLTTCNSVNAELKERLGDLERESRILKESNSKLMDSALKAETKVSVPAKFAVTADSTSSLMEEKLNSALKDKSDLSLKLDAEKELNQKQEEELRQLRIAHFQLKEQHDELKEKLKFFSKDNKDLNFTEFEEVLSVLKRQKERAFQSNILSKDAGNEETQETLKHQLNQVQADHAETISELEKTRNMLVVQHRINRDYQKEVENLSKRLSDSQKDYDIRIAEQSRLLELRAVRVQRLERQLKDIAYGTTQYKFEPDNNVVNEDELDVSSSSLKDGENLFEIHAHKVSLSKEGLKLLQDENPITFLTWGFFHFEIKSTPCLSGPNPQFNFTAEYVLIVDDLFLHYINKEKVAIEFHQAFGTDYTTIAAANINLQKVLEMPKGKLQGTVPLIGIREGETGVIFGSLEFWIRLRLPVEQSMRLYKERSKALGYMRVNAILTNKAVATIEDGSSHIFPDGINELHVKIVRCRGLVSRNKGDLPSAYCVYKFYNKPDHDSEIITCSANPEFDDHAIYHLPMDLHLDQYLRAKVLEIYVFDDSDPELTSYIGIANIPLLSLAHDNSIRGEFQLKGKDGNSNGGSIDVIIYWQYSYSPPKGSIANTEECSSTNELLLPKEREQLENDEPPAVTVIPPTPKPRTGTLQTSHLAKVPETASPSTAIDRKPPVVPRESTPKKRSVVPVASPDVSKIISQSSKPEVVGERSLTDESSSSDSSVIVEGDVQNDGKRRDSTGTFVIESEAKDFGSDSEVVLPATSFAPEANVAENSPVCTVVIAVCYLTLLENAKVLKNPEVKMLFVEYRFLDFPQEELETPYSLPKPKPNQKIFYNFKKVFHLGDPENEKKCQLLANMINSKSPSKSRIRFTVVSEPLEDNQDAECEDIGYSYVDFNKMLRNQKDLIEEHIAVFDANDSSTIIGHLNVSVEALTALKFVQSKSF